MDDDATHDYDVLTGRFDNSWKYAPNIYHSYIQYAIYVKKISNIQHQVELERQESREEQKYE